MPLIATPMLTRARAEHDRLLPDTCTILRATRTEDAGGVTEDWANPITVASGVACRLGPVGTALGAAAEAVIGGRSAVATQWRLELPALTDITTAYRVVVTVDTQAARTFEVAYVSGARSWELGRWALLVEGA